MPPGRSGAARPSSRCPAGGRRRLAVGAAAPVAGELALKLPLGGAALILADGLGYARALPQDLREGPRDRRARVDRVAELHAAVGKTEVIRCQIAGDREPVE